MSFLRDLLSDSGAVSSKRFGGLEVLQLVVIMVIGDQFTKFKLNMNVLEWLLWFVLICWGLNTAISIKSLTAKKEVASDMVNATGDNDSAKETLQSDKPKG
jgi:hypothetical protein